MQNRPDWLPPSATPRAQSVAADWTIVDQPMIEGVVVHEVRHVPTAYGHLTELFRQDWQLDHGKVDQVFQSHLDPGAVSAWHAHAHTTDRLFVASGRMRIVLFDDRPDSATRGNVIELRAGTVRPMLIVVPPRVWHGVRNDGPTVGALVNLVDEAYDYQSPDHWALPADTEHIPYRLVP